MSTSDRYHQVFQISWEQLQRDCRILAGRLVERPWDRIIGIARGGLVPAAIMARELDVRYVDTVCISSYSLREQGGLEVLKGLDLSGDLSRTLIIDDLVDTGKTASFVREMMRGATFATVYAKPAGLPYVDEFVSQVSQDTWILFPWDAVQGYCDPIAAARRPLS